MPDLFSKLNRCNETIMKKIKANARFKIQQGKLEEFKEMVNQIIEVVRDNEKGTLAYNFFINEKRMECVAVETYENSDAVLIHGGNIGELLSNMMEISTLKLSFYGDVSDELRDALEPLGARFFPFYSGL